MAPGRRSGEGHADQGNPAESYAQRFEGRSAIWTRKTALEILQDQRPESYAQRFEGRSSIWTQKTALEILQDQRPSLFSAGYNVVPPSGSSILDEVNEEVGELWFVLLYERVMMRVDSLQANDPPEAFNECLQLLRYLESSRGFQLSETIARVEELMRR